MPAAGGVWAVQHALGIWILQQHWCWSGLPWGGVHTHAMAHVSCVTVKCNVSMFTCSKASVVLVVRSFSMLYCHVQGTSVKGILTVDAVVSMQNAGDWKLYQVSAGVYNWVKDWNPNLETNINPGWQCNGKASVCQVCANGTSLCQRVQPL